MFSILFKRFKPIFSFYLPYFGLIHSGPFHFLFLVHFQIPVSSCPYATFQFPHSQYFHFPIYPYYPALFHFSLLFVHFQVLVFLSTRPGQSFSRKIFSLPSLSPSVVLLLEDCKAKIVLKMLLPFLFWTMWGKFNTVTHTYSKYLIFGGIFYRNANWSLTIFFSFFFQQRDFVRSFLSSPFPRI